MVTLTDIQQELKKLGYNVAPRTFWRYYRSGVLPKGEKLAGRGNVLYFPDNAAEVLMRVMWLHEAMRLPLKSLRKMQRTDKQTPITNLTAVELLAALGSVLAAPEWCEKKLTRDDIAQIAQEVRQVFERFGVQM